MENETQQPAGVGHVAMAAPNKRSRESSERDVLQRIITELSSLPAASRRRIFDTAGTFFDIQRARTDSVPPPPAPMSSAPKPCSSFRFSEDEPPTPKQFMLTKAPATEVARVACLAYYLTHFGSVPHFKTRDITDLNTEAAQRRFSNAANAVVNATNTGYLLPSIKGCKQITAAGEQYVEALPDREAAREAFEKSKPRRAARVPRDRKARNSKE